MRLCEYSFTYFSYNGEKMKKILTPAYSLKLKKIILFFTRGLIFFFEWSYSQRCFDVDQRCENRRWKWQRCFDVVRSNQRWNRQHWLDVVERCKFQRWRTQRCFNVGLTLCDVTTSHQPKNKVEPTLKCLLGKFHLTWDTQCVYASHL